MHGREFGTALPLFGKKVLAVKNGQLEMHGKPRDYSWAELKDTVYPGGKFVTIHDILTDTTFDWAAGEEIVIAQPTTKDVMLSREQLLPSQEPHKTQSSNLMKLSNTSTTLDPKHLARVRIWKLLLSEPKSDFSQETSFSAEIQKSQTT
jgi:hypothetical protein